jgi:pyruvate formate lyase activating enzyme
LKFRLGGFTELSTVDWPGKLTTLVFFQGCNLRCPWCQNVPLIDPLGGEEADTEEVLRHVGAHEPIVDSVVLTGGEPSLQPSACLEILKEAKKIGLRCAIETNGTVPQALRSLLPYLDLVAIDVKAPLDDQPLYEKVTGSTGLPELTQKVKKSLKLAINSKTEVEARTTVVPRLNDSEEIVAQIAKDVKGVDCLRLQQFRNQRTLDPSFQQLSSPGREKLLKLAHMAKRKGLKKVKIFTVEGGLEDV